MRDLLQSILYLLREIIIFDLFPIAESGELKNLSSLLIVRFSYHILKKLVYCFSDFIYLKVVDRQNDQVGMPTMAKVFLVSVWDDTNVDNPEDTI